MFKGIEMIVAQCRRCSGPVVVPEAMLYPTPYCQDCGYLPEVRVEEEIEEEVYGDAWAV